MTKRTISISKLIGVLAVLTVAGCSSMNSNLLDGERIDYQSASKKDGATPTLEIPPDLTQLSRDNRYAIPAGGSVTASSFNAKPNVAATKQPTSIALNSSQDMQIERDGTQRWLVVKQSPEVVWPKVKEFWQENGFLISQESQATGVMETDWAENRAKLPEDFVRKTLSYVFDSVYSTGERDKFRTRLERRPNGSTEIYISHRGLEEVLTGADKSNVTWANRPNDPALEATLLTRLMVSLGATQEKAKEIVGAPIAQPARAKLAGSMIEVDEGFDRAWRRVGLGLDRAGFTVEDRDRAKGLYFVRYVDQEAQANNEGLFTKLFGAGDKEANAKRYRISVKGDGNVSHVSVQNNDGVAEKSTSASKILDLLLEQLK